MIAEQERSWAHNVFFGSDLQGVTLFVAHCQSVLEVKGDAYFKFGDDGAFSDLSGSK